MTDDRFSAARSFLLTEGRLLERRLFATLFEGAPATGVVDALRGYQNDDGGFGHGLEPDKLCPASLPIDVEMAFHALLAAGGSATDGAMVGRACDWLAAVADDAGAVPLAFPVMERYPRAEHWSDWTYAYGIHPTAGLAGLLHALHVEHPWRERATRFTWDAVARGLPDEAHALGEVLVFLEHGPEPERGAAVAEAVAAQLPTARWFRADPEDPGYGVTPLHYAPTPTSRWRGLFGDEQIEGHLDRLERDQQPDGGWPITWEPPGKAATLAYRGMETLRAVRTLVAYGRWTAPSSQTLLNTPGPNSSLLT